MQQQAVIYDENLMYRENKISLTQQFKLCENAGVKVHLTLFDMTWLRKKIQGLKMQPGEAELMIMIIIY